MEGLEREPTAFGSSLYEAKEKDDKKWKNDFESMVDKESIVFAMDGSEVIGTIGYYWDKHEKMKHTATIVAVYLKEEYRSKGIGKLMSQKILQIIESKSKFVKIKLQVTSSNVPAKKLYESIGFEYIGTAKKELFVNGTYHDTDLMEYYLK
jgi:RimJ/RimL family protein N-acetyltransferase